MEIKSRLLTQLDRDITKARDPAKASCLKAHRAIVLARHGALGPAREQLTALHQQAFHHPHPSLSAWLLLAEGLMVYYTDFGSGAQDKIQQALDLACEYGLVEVQGQAAAWLSQLAYVQHDLDAALRLARQALAVAEPQHHVARSRAHMTVGLAWHYAGQPKQATAWYQQARAHALFAGDDGSISALIYNMAVMRTAQLRWQALSTFARMEPEQLLGADSVQHYDRAVGARVMSELTPLMQAQLLALQSEFSRAQALYAAHLPQALSHGLARWDSALRSDWAWCLVQCGDKDAALQQALLAEQGLAPTASVDQDLDDRAATHTRLSQVFSALGDGEKLSLHREQAESTWTAFAKEQVRWQAVLEASGLQPDLPRVAQALSV